LPKTKNIYYEANKNEIIVAKPIVFSIIILC